MTNRLLEDFAEITSDWFWEMDENYRFSYFSSGLETVSGVSLADEIGKCRIDIAANATDGEYWRPHLDDLINKRKFRDFVYPRRVKDGAIRWVKVSGEPVFDSQGAFKGYRGVGADITAEREARDQLDAAVEALRRANEQLDAQNTRFSTAIENMPVGLCMFDSDRRLIVCNRRYAEMYGLTATHTAPGTTLDEILAHRISVGKFPGTDPKAYLRERHETIDRGLPAISVMKFDDGQTISVHHLPMEGGGWIATHEDITDRCLADEKIAYMARHDVLTGLPNRVLFRERMLGALARLGEGGRFAVLCLDLDDFKVINDTLGHPAGDALLQAVTRRLQVCVRETDVIARLGGDEFAILQDRPPSAESTGALARRIIEVLSAAFMIEGQQVVVGASIGIALAPEHGSDPEELMKNAELALYRAKDDGRRTHRFFEAEMDAHVQRRRALEADLRRAIAAGEFELFYQPIVSLSDGRINGLEALLRWRHPDRGLLLPDSFIALSEEIGLIVPLSDWILQQACKDIAALPGELTVAVNLSPVQFKYPGVAASVMQALAGADLDPTRLELEITESVLLLESEETLSALHSLRDLGVRISMDDFGTGYSSLSYLRRFPFDRIKIDRSFIADIETKPDCRAIINAVAGLGADLGIDTTAEGVETESQLHMLLAAGLSEVQGYLFSRPAPLEEVRAILSRAEEAIEAAA